MKTLIIDNTSTDKLHTQEFTGPVIDIVEKFTEYDVINYIDFEKISLDNYNKIILCGTALLDFKYLDDISIFEKLKNSSKPILGICAGAQILGKLFGADIVDSNEIGLIEISIKKNDIIFDEVDFNEVYSLHNSALKLHKKFEVLIENNNGVCECFKINNFYGVLFHPEVRNKKLIENFVNL